MRHPSPRALLAGTVLLTTLALASTAFAAVSNPTPVLTKAGDEFAYRVSGTNSIWYQNTPKARTHYNAYIRTTSGQKQMNAAGTNAYAGGLDGTTVIYQQVANGVSHLIRYNVTTGTRSALGSAFNSSGGWEYSPSLSGNWVLWAREAFNGSRTIMLRNLSSGQQYTFAGGKVQADPGQVNGDWAVWDSCTKTGCSVYRFQISTHTTTKLINTLPPAKWEYAPSVAPDGTAYYLHAGATCGDHVRLVMHGVGQPETVLRSYSLGIDSGDTFATPGTTGTDIYYPRIACKSGRSDIYKVNNN